MEDFICTVEMDRQTTKWGASLYCYFTPFFIVQVGCEQIHHSHWEITPVGQGLQNLGLSLAFMAYEQGGIFIEPFLLNRYSNYSFLLARWMKSRWLYFSNIMGNLSLVVLIFIQSNIKCSIRLFRSNQLGIWDLSCENLLLYFIIIFIYLGESIWK